MDYFKDLFNVQTLRCHFIMINGSYSASSP